MLNFTEGALCYVGSARFGRGQGIKIVTQKCDWYTFQYRSLRILMHLNAYPGPIWLDDLDCGIEDEVLEDCGHRAWGVHGCSHYEDVGVVCRTSELSV